MPEARTVPVADLGDVGEAHHTHGPLLLAEHGEALVHVAKDEVDRRVVDATVIATRAHDARPKNLLVVGHEVDLVLALDTVAEEATPLCLGLVEVDGTSVVEVHESGGKGVVVRLDPAPEEAEDGRMVVGGDVAPIALGKADGMLAAMAQKRPHDEDRADDKGQQADAAQAKGEGPAHLAPGVGAIGPVTLLGKHGVQAALQTLGHVAQPLGREGHADLGKVGGAHGGHRADHVLAHQPDLARERRVMLPHAHVISGNGRLANGNGQMDGAGDVIGGLVPAVRDELPVELAHVLPTRDHARKLVDHTVGVDARSLEVEGHARDVALGARD